MGELSSVRMGEGGCPGRTVGGAGLCQVGTGGGLDRVKGMAMRIETWRRRERVKVCEKPEEDGSAERAKISPYWRKHGGFGGPGIPLEVLPQLRDVRAVVMLTEMNQAFLVNEELGEGILANPHPPCLHRLTGTECQVSGGNKGWWGVAPRDSCWHC